MAKYEYKEASKGPPKGKKLSHLEVHKAENGGHVVKHHFKNEGMVYHNPEDHVYGADEGNMALSHIAKHMGIAAEGRDEDEGDE